MRAPAVAFVPIARVVRRLDIDEDEEHARDARHHTVDEQQPGVATVHLTGGERERERWHHHSSKSSCRVIEWDEARRVTTTTKNGGQPWTA